MFVGRGRELARFSALVRAVSAGHGQLVVLTGEAGIGKSRLAAQVLAECASGGFAVFSGTADEVEQRRPFGVVLDALGEHTGGEIARLPGGDGGSAPGLEARIADLLVAAIEEACLAGPVAVLLDDLQWADESSLVAVNGMARLASSYPLLLVCVLRPYPAGGPLRALLAALDYRRAHRIGLEAMGAGEVAELAARLADAPPGESLRQALEKAGGNPFYVSELVARLVKEGGASVSEDGLLELGGAGLPPSLRQVILDGLRFLPEATLEVLRAAAVVGRRFSVSDAGLISPGTVSDVAAVLAPAQRAGIVAADGVRLCFRHDLVRETIYEDLAPAVRTSLHRHLAGKLAERGARWERVAAHLMLGGEPGDTEAVALLRQAAREAAGSSPAIAAQLLGRALELAEAEPVGPRSADGAAALRRGLLAELVRPLLWTGQAARAEQVCAEGLQARPPAADEPLFWLGLANARLLQGRFADARGTCQDAMACQALAESDRVHLSAVQALSGVYLGDSQGVELARRIVATAAASSSKATAQEAIAQWELFTGRADLALAACEQADSIRAGAGPGSRMWDGSGIRVRMWQALALLDLDRLDEAARLLEQDIAAKLAVPALPHAFLAVCRYHAGRLGEAAAECQAAIAAAEAVGSFVPASAPALAATIALRQGRLDEAERLTGYAEQVRTPAEAAGDTIVRWTRMLLLEAAGHTERAADAGAAALDAYRRAGFASYIAWHAPDLVRVALLAGRPDQARLAVQEAERAFGQVATLSRQAGALRARGLFTSDTTVLLAAVAVARRLPRPLDLALTLRDAAAALASHGDLAGARPLASEAFGLMAELGVAGEERSARALLRRAGLPVSARARHSRVRHGWDSLTPAEQRVVSLAADGRSNPEIARILYISRRTVGWHLSNAFHKLGLSSRAELVAETLRNGRG